MASPYREGVTDVAPWLSTLRVTGLLLFLLAGPVDTPHAAAYEPGPAESRAGSRAGEGRERPGREATPTDEDSAAAHPDSSAGRRSPGASVAPESPSADTAAPTERPDRPVDAHEAADHPVRTSEPVLRVLPLGSGLVLIGLGLGLAFLALRTRRS
ncbi:hypothetical protein O1Q96_01980 [Streptomyces sp. Qhu-G9]|uniref:hypothetical protein n=1 Tax=Streptomyces sp. Qhu-G9 TaxID=3452799 RepID=UPI0022AC8BF9|nr:hypothetical protein [Streptomyces aurantiacus]WAU78628.1 hypothetical protein O1Q96_01980 [Streptomyces aurantiacus]